MTASSSPDFSPATSAEASQKMREMVMLPKDFEPSDMDVLIGRGKRARAHKGNNRLRGLIEFMIPEYSAAGSNKDEKSYIIKEIVTQIRKSSPDGGFVKFDKAQNRWFEVGDFLAREKISQTFRDAMGDAYSSSNPYKRKRRSFEKKHNAIMDIIKSGRGSSPTSVAQTGSSSPLSAPSPEPGAIEAGARVVRSSVTPSPPMSPPHQSPALMELYKRPGQIGFARRSMLQFGITAPTAVGLHSTASMPQIRAPSSIVVPMTRPVPHFVVPSTMAAFNSRRASLSGPATYSPALMAEVMNRQRLVQHAAMMRRTSQGI